MHHVPTLTLECGTTLYDVPVAYKTWGRLAPTADNVMVVCHHITGSPDLSEWWPSLTTGGSNVGFDTRELYVVCVNCLGSPYGTASPVTAQSPGKRWGPEFPATTIRDDVW
jgi:homoserine O-acetyltransferase